MEMFSQFLYGSDSPILILNAKRLCTVLNVPNISNTESEIFSDFLEMKGVNKEKLEKLSKTYLNIFVTMNSILSYTEVTC